MGNTSETHRSIYDPPPQEDDDLWFLPGPPEDAAPTDPPWPVADNAPVIDVAKWQKAEQVNAVALARAASAFSVLDERLQQSPAGFRNRLALEETAKLSWISGTRIPVERIAMFGLSRTSSVTDDIRELGSSWWMYRRLIAEQGPLDWPGGLVAFLDRTTSDRNIQRSLVDRPTGEELRNGLEEWHQLLQQIRNSHPITQMVFGTHAWRILELSAPGDLQENAVVAARVGAKEARGGAFFLPVGDAIRRDYTSNPLTDRLSNWYDNIRSACLQYVSDLDKLDGWQKTATEKSEDLSGATPPRLVMALAEHPVLSVEMAAVICKVSKSSALRNLTLFEERELVREVTGHSRFRLWAIKYESRNSLG